MRVFAYYMVQLLLLHVLLVPGNDGQFNVVFRELERLLVLRKVLDHLGVESLDHAVAVVLDSAETVRVLLQIQCEDLVEGAAFGEGGTHPRHLVPHVSDLGLPVRLLHDTAVEHGHVLLRVLDAVLEVAAFVALKHVS